MVELDALAGEPMDVLVNGYLIAQGEVVVVNDKFGIRLTDVVTPSERLRRVSKRVDAAMTQSLLSIGLFVRVVGTGADGGSSGCKRDRQAGAGGWRSVQRDFCGGGGAAPAGGHGGSRARGRARLADAGRDGPGHYLPA